MSIFEFLVTRLGIDAAGDERCTSGHCCGTMPRHYTAAAGLGKVTLPNGGGEEQSHDQEELAVQGGT
ncbi:MAG: hypothetical protein ACLGXA_08885, partial [Acidobacteriota bacterium]